MDSKQAPLLRTSFTTTYNELQELRDEFVQKMPNMSQDQMIRDIEQIKVKVLECRNTGAPTHYKEKYQNSTINEFVSDLNYKINSAESFQYRDALVTDPFNQSLINERDERLESAQKSLIELRDIQKSMNLIINEQGASIGKVCSDAVEARNNLTQAAEELSQSTKKKSLKSRIVTGIAISVALFALILLCFTVIKVVMKS